MTKQEALKELAAMKLTKAQVLSLQIKLLVEAGISPDVALDTVCGAGSFDRLARSIWEGANS